jgi:SAM-dependent methyltransferase
VYYADVCAARSVEGIEIGDEVVRRCQRLAAEFGCENVRFKRDFAESLSFPDELFDCVVSYDVLEHVEDPRRALAETARVLKPNGKGFLVFPTYLGALSSHLDYLTQLPALHRIFDPDVVIDVVNEFLVSDRSFIVLPQPPPHRSALGYTVLPNLNGLRHRDVHAAVTDAGLEIQREVLTPIIRPHTKIRGAKLVGTALDVLARGGLLPELLIGGIALVVRKPDRSIRPRAA